MFFVQYCLKKQFNDFNSYVLQLEPINNISSIFLQTYMDQLDFSQLYCQSHPYELVNNFCNDERCLVGLCATCVCSHTEMHARNGTVPQYQNVRDTFISLRQQTRGQIDSLQQSQSKLISLKNNVELSKLTLKRTIQEIKEQAINKIREQFDTLQKKILADVNNQQKKQGFHSNLRFETLSKLLTQQIQIVLGNIQSLNSKQFLDCAKRLKKDGLQQTQLAKYKIEKEISDNSTYTANLKWNQNYKTDLLAVIKKMFTLQFVIPKLNGQLGTCISLINPNRVSQLSRSSSQSKTASVLSYNSSMMNFNKMNQSSSNFNSMRASDFMARYPSTVQKQSFVKTPDSLMTSQMSESRVIKQKQNDKKDSFAQPSYTSSDVINRQSLIHKLGRTSQMKDSKIRLF